MAEANVSQLAKLLSAVMEYEDLPVEIHNAIADWSCPGGRVTNNPKLFELILEARKKHPEDYEDIPQKVSHPVYPGEGPKLVFAEKEVPQSQPVATGLTLGQHISAVLNHPDIPSKLYNALGEAVTDMYRPSSVTESAEVIQALIDKHRELKLENQTEE